MNRLLKRVLLLAGLIFVVMQFVGPARTNPPVEPAQRLSAKVTVPADVDAIFTRSCRNCHSNETRWPWYAYVAPASWMVIGDVNHGREHLNVSAWTLSPEEGADLLDEICVQVRELRMPLPSYTWVHWDARLSDADRKRICDWTDEAAGQLMASAEAGSE